MRKDSLLTIFPLGVPVRGNKRDWKVDRRWPGRVQGRSLEEVCSRRQWAPKSESTHKEDNGIGLKNQQPIDFLKTL